MTASRRLRDTQDAVEVAIGGGLVASILVIQAYSVLMRYAFAAAPSWAEELSTYALVGVVMLSLGWVLRRRGHIRVNILRDAVSARARRRIDAVTTFGAIVWSVALVWGGASLALDAWQIDLRSESALQMPLFLPYLLVPAGSILLLIALVRQPSGIVKGVDPSRPQV